MNTNTTLAEQKTFEQRMIDKVKNDIGDLITNEELSKIVAKAMDEIFFAKKVEKDYYGNIKSSKPALVEDMVKDLMKPEVEKAVEHYISEHKEEISEMIQTCVQNGMAGAITTAINNFFYMQMNNFTYDIQQRIQNSQARY